MKSKKIQQKKSSLAEILLKYAVPLIISIGLCWLLFRDFDFSEMWLLITTGCHYRWIVLMMFISVISHIVRAMRWQIQLNALDVRPPLFFTVLSIFGTYAVNLVFPRLGELWRTGYIAKRQDASFTAVFGSMVADRVADTLTVLLLLIVTFFIATDSLTEYLAGNKTLYDTFVGIISSPVVWVLLVGFIIFVWWLLTTSSRNAFVVKIKEFVNGLWRGFVVVTRMKGRLRWLVLTVLLWGCYFLQLYVAFFSFDFTAELLDKAGIVPALVAFVLSSIAMGVPANGGIGPWQWAVIFALGIYGIDTVHAAAFANLVLGSNTLLLIALGLFTFITIAISKKHQKSLNNNCNHLTEHQEKNG